MPTKKITDESFENEIKNNKNLVIDFWAEWCGPCKQIGPVLEEISNELKEDVVIAKHNIDEEPNTKDSVNSNQNSVQDTIDSPMVGVIYLSAKPSSPTFIKKGQKIKKGTTICLIEAMKTFNEIKADKDGVVSRILVKNAEAVEFGQPLIELK